MAKSELKSMTAFGRAIVDFPYGRLIVDVQSVNRRYLEITVNLPRQLGHYEIELRKVLSASLGRGMVTLSINWKKGENQPCAVVPNLGLAKGLKSAWKSLAQELKIQEDIPISLLIREEGLFILEESEKEPEIYRKALLQALQEAIEALINMKQQEGYALVQALKGYLKNLSECIDFIEAHSDEAPEKFRKKLLTRLEEVFKGSFENEERILHEVALYAEKVDMSEEIVRFKSHLDQFNQLLEKPLESQTETRGKNLDFLLQELSRECNTIGSKSGDLEITKRVVTMKGELEKIREQVQNIE